MKSKLIAVSLLAATGMFADTNNNGYYNSQGSMNNNCCPSDCCKPCCVPKPKPCIDCECYVPKFYDLQCDWGVFVDVEFLYWYARETHLPFALRVEGKEEVFGAAEPLVFAPKGRKYLDTKWDPGFRVGLGWNTDCDGWDLYLNWTWMQNKEREATSVPDYGNTANSFFYPLNGQFALINPWVNASFAPGALPASAEVRTFDRVSSLWKFWLNSIDLELGKKYWLSKCFAMRPYAGLRGAWVKTRFNTRSSRTFTSTDELDTIIFRDRFTNRFWGVGLLAGLQPTWYFTPCFALYSNVDVALIWGQFKAKKRERYSDVFGANTVIAYSNRMTDDFYMMQSILDLAIGLRWEDTWCCDRYRTALDLGWEHHIWFDTNHRLKTIDYFGANSGSTGELARRGFRTFDETPGNLMYGGLVVRLRFDF